MELQDEEDRNDIFLHGLSSVNTPANILNVKHCREQQTSNVNFLQEQSIDETVAGSANEIQH